MDIDVENQSFSENLPPFIPLLKQGVLLRKKVDKKDNHYYVKSEESRLSGPFSYDEAILYKSLNHDQRKRYKKKLFILDKKNKPCVDCGIKKDVNSMTFDHIKEKSFELANGSKKSWSKIIKEIDRCEVVCRSCHNIREFLRKRNSRLSVEDLSSLLDRCEFLTSFY